MATPPDVLTTGVAPLPRGQWVNPQTGMLTPEVQTWLQRQVSYQIGEVLKGKANEIRQTLVDLNTEVGDVEASVDGLAEVYATDNAATARLIWTVATGTNVATIEQTSASGYDDGTWNGSAITLTANEISLLAAAINFGANATFEATYNTLYAEDDERVRILGPFPATGDLLVWAGPASVSLNSETWDNGYLTLSKSNGLYVSTVPDPSFRASTSGNALFNGPGTGSQTTNSVFVTPENGTGPYNYFWELFNESGPTITITSPTGSATTFSATLGAGETASANARVTVIDTDDNEVAIAACGVALINTL